jgi:membrane protease YdiL (CAAX protease family)
MFNLFNMTFDLFRNDSNSLKIISTTKSKIDHFICAFFINLFITFLLSLLLSVINSYLIKNYTVNMLLLRKSNVQNIQSLINLNIIFCLIAPLFEEILFRLWLSFKKRDLFIFIFILSYFIFSKISNVSVYAFYINKTSLNNLLYSLLITSLFFIYFNSKFYKISVRTKFNFYIISSICFGLIHIVNFLPLRLSIIWVYPLFILPQLFSGIILGYIRVKNGFIWSLLLHICINSFVFLIVGFK